jgi:hypothetical protein
MHARCFTCCECSRPICDASGTASPYYERHGKFYCRSDYIRLFMPVCAVHADPFPFSYFLQLAYPHPIHRTGLLRVCHLQIHLQRLGPGHVQHARARVLTVLRLRPLHNACVQSSQTPAPAAVFILLRSRSVVLGRRSIRVARPTRCINSSSSSSSSSNESRHMHRGHGSNCRRTHAGESHSILAFSHIATHEHLEANSNAQCLPCSADAAESIGDMRSVWARVVEGMHTWLGLSLPCDLTSKLQLVDPASMSRHSHVHQTRDSRLACQCITGLTLNQKSLENGREISRGVTAILMLRGLGHDMAHGVLAHECVRCSRVTTHESRRTTQLRSRNLLLSGSCTRTCTATATPRSTPWSKRASASSCLLCNLPSTFPVTPHPQ